MVQIKEEASSPFPFGAGGMDKVDKTDSHFSKKTF
jgi:hypothetical protein